MQEEPEAYGKVADAVDGNWVDRLPVEFPKPYLRLSRADRPIGTWLLFIPCSWSALLAFASQGGSVEHLAWVLFVCAVGSFLMRGAGCTWNDFTDRDIDAQVARTKSRPLPSGQTTPKAALVWMCLQALIAFGLLLTFNPTAIYLGIAALVPVCIYPFAKRFTWWPQAFLGIAFNWGALMGWVAMTGTIDWPPVMLYLAGITWTLFYDTIYAHQDREDDALIGVKSTARLFGEKTRSALFYFLAATLIFMTCAVVLAFPQNTSIAAMLLSLIGIWAFGYHLHWQLTHVDIQDPENCLRIFRSNTKGGLIVTAGLVFAAVVAQAPTLS